MRIVCLSILLCLLHSVFPAQVVNLPIDFEGGSVLNSSFFNFDGGTATVITNPVPSAVNPSATVGQMIRNGGQVWAGAFLTTSTPVNFSVNPVICMKVYTTAPVGTRVSFKMEGCSGPCFYELNAYTTVTGEWETLCYDFTGQPAIYDRLVLLFDLGALGNGSANSTFYFDDIEQRVEPPLTLTPGSELFCPNTSVTLSYPGAGTYNWYADPAGTNLVQSASSTYTTPVLTSDVSYYVQDMTPTAFPPTDLGPSVPGGTAIGNSLTTSTFFTSNLDNGLFYSVDILLHIPTGPAPSNTCTYRVDIYNLTQGTSRTLTQNFLSPLNFTLHSYTFSSPLPISLNDQLEMRISSITGHPCYCTSSNAGNNGLFLPFPNSYDPQITFTSHSSNGVSNVLMSGLNYRMTGNYIDPTLYQVNAIADCGTVLPVELIHFDAKEENGDAVLSWSTASELNNSHFILSRSQDGMNFESIATVPGAGNSSSVLHYSHRDQEPYSGLSYYKLTQVDFDGSFSKDWIAAIQLEVKRDFILSPNPTEDWISIQSTQTNGHVQEIQLMDMTGRIIICDKSKHESGAFARDYDLSDLPKGIYQVLILYPDGHEAFKIMTY